MEMYDKLFPEVVAVGEHMDAKLAKVEAEHITRRICEEHEEDSIIFWVHMSDIAELSDDDDWSDVNGCIETMIEKYMGGAF